MVGLLANFLTIIVGGTLGLLLKKVISEKLSDLLIKAMALVVIYIGVSGMIEGENSLIIVISILIGTLIGELLDLDKRLNNLGEKLEKRFKGEGFSKGFTTSTLIFCIGAMAIVGSIKAGLSNDNSILFTKAVIDGVTALCLASALGYGVIFSSVPTTIYQGMFVLLATLVEPYFNDYLISEITCVGSILILAIGLNMLNVTKIKVMNILPSIFIPIILCQFIK